MLCAPVVRGLLDRCTRDDVRVLFRLALVGNVVYYLRVALGALTSWTFYAVDNAIALQRRRHFTPMKWNNLVGVLWSVRQHAAPQVLPDADKPHTRGPDVPA